MPKKEETTSPSRREAETQDHSNQISQANGEGTRKNNLFAHYYGGMNGIMIKVVYL